MLSNLAYPFKFLYEYLCLHFTNKRVLPDITFSTTQGVKTGKINKNVN